MNRYRNKLVYDASTGEIRDDRNHMSMLEDYWLPRREGGRGTEITTLPSGSNLGESDDIVYFNGNYTVHLTCRFQDLKQSKVSLSAEQLKSLETNLNLQNSYNVSVRSLPHSSQTS